jgi:hypothetical protein
VLEPVETSFELAVRVEIAAEDSSFQEPEEE